jgi:hypothetical protein
MSREGKYHFQPVEESKIKNWNICFLCLEVKEPLANLIKLNQLLNQSPNPHIRRIISY